jgi:hypothetical protein
MSAATTSSGTVLAWGVLRFLFEAAGFDVVSASFTRVLICIGFSSVIWNHFALKNVVPRDRIISTKICSVITFYTCTPGMNMNRAAAFFHPPFCIAFSTKTLQNATTGKFFVVPYKEAVPLLKIALDCFCSWIVRLLLVSLPCHQLHNLVVPGNCQKCETDKSRSAINEKDIIKTTNLRC